MTACWKDLVAEVVRLRTIGRSGPNSDESGYDNDASDEQSLLTVVVSDASSKRL
jgi:hypothetical protein